MDENVEFELVSCENKDPDPKEEEKILSDEMRDFLIHRRKRPELSENPDKPWWWNLSTMVYNQQKMLEYLESLQQKEVEQKIEKELQKQKVKLQEDNVRDKYFRTIVDDCELKQEIEEQLRRDDFEICHKETFTYLLSRYTFVIVNLYSDNNYICCRNIKKSKYESLASKYSSYNTKFISIKDTVNIIEDKMPLQVWNNGFMIEAFNNLSDLETFLKHSKSVSHIIKGHESSKPKQKYKTSGQLREETYNLKL